MRFKRIYGVEEMKLGFNFLVGLGCPGCYCSVTGLGIGFKIKWCDI
jgi:hypothetical protein